MHIFYILSVLSLLLGGFICSAEILEKKIKFFNSLNNYITDNYIVGFITGIAALVIGAFKFALPYGRFNIDHLTGITPVFGDFLPAVVGIVIGSILIISADALKKNDHTLDDPINPEDKPLLKIKKFSIKYKGIVGFVALGVGAFHFLFPFLPIF